MKPSIILIVIVLTACGDEIIGESPAVAKIPGGRFERGRLKDGTTL